MTAAERQRYTVVAIVLHWTIALAMFGQIALGWWMGDALRDPDTQSQAVAAFQLHKSIGLSVLALSLFRLIWRLTHKPPPMPAQMPAWEKTIAAATHWMFYALIILLPLTGWLYASTGWSAEEDRALEVPTLFFGLFQVPGLIDLSQASEELRRDLGEALGFTHSKLAWAVIILAALHVGAALKHHFFDRDEVLSHMLPAVRPLGAEAPQPTHDPKRQAGLLAGFALVLAAFAGAIYLFVSPPAASVSAPAPLEAAETEDAASAEEAAPSPPGAPPLWRVERGASAIRFSGAQAGAPFEGAFSRWRAEIRFDPENLDASSATVTIQTASASTGQSLQDQTLPAAEWFDTANHPTATFHTTRIRHRDGDAYEARGVLVIKGQEIGIDLPFTLTIDGDRALMEGRAEIDRAEADLGQASDPNGDYVSREIGVSVRVEAIRAP